MPDNHDNFQTPTKQKLFPKNVLLKIKNRQACIIVHGFR
jgi:hypothetical protein